MKAWEPGDDSRLPPANHAFSWTRELGRYRMRSRLITSGFVVLAAVLVLLIAHEQMQPAHEATSHMLSPYDAPEYTQADRVATIEEFTPRLAPQLVLFTDELADVKEDPSNEEQRLNIYWVKQAALHLVQAEKASSAKNSDMAMHHYQKALAIFPELEGVHEKTGLQHIRDRDFEQAADAFRHAAVEDEKSHAIANNLAVACIQVDALDEAEKMLTRSLELNPEYLPALFNLATLYLKQKNLESAAETFERYLTMKPTDLKASHRYAHTLLEMEDWEAARKVLSQLADYSPDSAPVFFRLAQALAHTDNMKGAMAALRRGTSLVDARHALSWMSKNEFDPLRSDPEFASLADELSRGSVN